MSIITLRLGKFAAIENGFAKKGLLLCFLSKCKNLGSLFINVFYRAGPILLILRESFYRRRFQDFSLAAVLRCKPRGCLVPRRQGHDSHDATIVGPHCVSYEARRSTYSKNPRLFAAFDFHPQPIYLRCSDAAIAGKMDRSRLSSRILKIHLAK